jgi:hypothetical protein
MSPARSACSASPFAFAASISIQPLGRGHSSTRRSGEPR